MTTRVQPRASDWRGLLMITLAAMLWGTSGVVSRFLFARSDITPLGISASRLAVAALCLVALRALGGAWPQVPSRLVRWVLLVGLCLAEYQLSFFAAVQLAGVSIATLVALGLTPVLVAAGAAVAFREPASPRVVAAIACGLAGLALLVGDPTAGAGPNVPLGATLAVGSAAGFASVTLLSRRLSRHVAAADVTLLSFVVGALLLLPVALVAGVGPTLATVRLPEVGLLLYLGTLPTALAYALFFRGIRSVPPAVAAGLTLVEPLTAVCLAAVLFGERLGAAGMLGGLLLAAGVLLLYVVRPRSEPALVQGAVRRS